MQPTRRYSAAWVGACSITLASLGCGGSDDVEVYPVQGKVTFEGRPLPGGGSISFVPMASQEGKSASAEIAADGTYRLTTYDPDDGSMAGDFRVVIAQVVDQEPVNTGDGQPRPKLEAGLPAADRIPIVYSDHQKSPLTAKVEEKAMNELDFNLNRSGQPPKP